MIIEGKEYNKTVCPFRSHFGRNDSLESQGIDNDKCSSQCELFIPNVLADGGICSFKSIAFIFNEWIENKNK